MVWVGAVVVVIGWFGRGWMQVLPPAFREFPAAGDDGGFGLALAYGCWPGRRRCWRFRWPGGRLTDGERVG